MLHPLLQIEVIIPPEFAKLVGVTKQTAILWIRSGKILSHKIGGRFFIPITELKRIKEEAFTSSTKAVAEVKQ